MTKEEVKELMQLARLMPRGPYAFSRRNNDIFSMPSESRSQVIIPEVYDFTKGDYFAKLSPEKVMWMLDKVEKYYEMIEDDLK